MHFKAIQENHLKIQSTSLNTEMKLLFSFSSLVYVALEYSEQKLNFRWIEASEGSGLPYTYLQK